MPSLRVDTNDASIEITRGVSNTISARVIGNGYNIGSSGVRVTERQDGDKVDLQVHVPNDWGSTSACTGECRSRFRSRRRPLSTCTPATGTLSSIGISGQARLDTGDGHIDVRTSTVTCMLIPATGT